ncbi:MAG: carboxymuconolactone decarboxylase family protein [Promethearchaeota archaeon]|nr:MAG: carboxymuconolactone decarboxylase family protein [Candidatus Lokiarchaeota archaeon]
MGNSKEKLNEVNETLKNLGRSNPNAMKGFQKFMNSVKSEGALSTKMKNIIGVALAVSRQCEYCVPFYVSQALESGASKEEIIEATLVAGLLGGGPAIMYAKRVFDALEDLT